METRRLFVYGTLMRGEPAHDLLGSVRYAGEALTRPEFDLVTLGPYPALVSGGQTQVRGEIYMVPDALIATLDDYEDVPRMYVRRSLHLIDGTLAEAYVMHAHHARGRARIASGDWRRR